MTDGYGRNIDYLRISVTDKCNLRCRYCMPAGGVELMPHENLLTLEEIGRVAQIMAGLGVRKVRLTGGEPLVRKNLTKLISDLHAADGIEEITMTTNGVLFGERARELKEAGLTGVNISLDTLNPLVFKEITGTDRHGQVMEAIDVAIGLGLPLKINCVPCREFNEKDVISMAELARTKKLDLRYIELMPIGCGKDFHGIASDEILQKLEERYGKSTPSLEIRGNGPAQYYNFEGFLGKIGFISPLSHKFCDGCNRVRLTAEGRLKLCLHYNYGMELKPLLRQNATDEEIRQAVKTAILQKPKEHDFKHKEGLKDSEQRKMVQIGG